MISGEEEFEKFLTKILDEMGISPELILEKEFGAKNRSRNCQKKTENCDYSGRDSIDDLRLCIKYLLFDLDATRRENLYYRRLLENKDI